MTAHPVQIRIRTLTNPIYLSRLALGHKSWQVDKTKTSTEGRICLVGCQYVYHQATQTMSSRQINMPYFILYNLYFHFFFVLLSILHQMDPLNWNINILYHVITLLSTFIFWGRSDHFYFKLGCFTVSTTNYNLTSPGDYS